MGLIFDVIEIFVELVFIAFMCAVLLIGSSWIAACIGLATVRRVRRQRGRKWQA